MFHDSLVADLEVVSIEDGALDMSINERRAYGESLDPKLLKVLPAKHPVRFVLRPLSYGEMVAIEGQPAVSKLAMCFMFGVREVRVDAASTLRPGTRSPSQADPSRCIWSDDEMNALMQRFGMRRIFEIGNAIHIRTLEGNGVGGSIFFEPLRSSLDALRATESRRVERLKATAAETQSSDAQPPSQSP